MKERICYLIMTVVTYAVIFTAPVFTVIFSYLKG